MHNFDTLLTVIAIILWFCVNKAVYLCLIVFNIYIEIGIKSNLSLSKKYATSL